MSSNVEAENNTNVPLDADWTCVAFLGDTSGSMCQLDTKELAQGVTKMIREEHTPMRLNRYGAKGHQVHHWVSVGLVTLDGITSDHYKCSGCPQERFVAKSHIRTFP